MKSAGRNLKRIKVQDLQVGMFIVKLGRSWLAHPFLRNQLAITSSRQIEKLEKWGVQEVYIDAARGLDISPQHPEGEPGAPAEGRNPIREGQAAGKDFAPLDPVPAAPRREPEIFPEEAGAVPSPARLDQNGEKEGAPAVPGGPAGPGARALAPSREPEKPEAVIYWENNASRVQERLQACQPAPPPSAEDPVPFGKEIEAARRVQAEAQHVIRNVMQDVRMGKGIEGDRVKRTVNSMVDSILRNRQALVSLTHIKKYDDYTFVHSLNVCVFTLSMARHLCLPREQMLEMGIGALLHDVGKMKVPPYILKKPDTLNEKEWVEVRKHPVYSLELMEATHGLPEGSKKLALQHHERFNGSGYPFGLKGEGITLFGQIAGIIDFYDAITTDRAYRKGIHPQEGIRQIYERSNQEFDPLLAERFIQCIGIYPFGTLVLLDTEEIGIVSRIKADSLLRPNLLLIYRNSKTPYPDPFLVDLNEREEPSQWYKRSIIMPLDPEKWSVTLESYFPMIQRALTRNPAPLHPS